MSNINESGSSAQKSASGVANVRFGVYNQPSPVAGKSVMPVSSLASFGVFQQTQLLTRVKISLTKTMLSNQEIT